MVFREAPSIKIYSAHHTARAAKGGDKMRYTDPNILKKLWYELRLLLVVEKNIREDGEVCEYVSARLGTDNLEWVTPEELSDLISEVKNTEH